MIDLSQGIIFVLNGAVCYFFFRLGRDVGREEGFHCGFEECQKQAHKITQKIVEALTSQFNEFLKSKNIDEDDWWKTGGRPPWEN